MDESEINNLQKKLQITDAAAQLYVEKNRSFTLHDIAKRTDITVAEIFNYFSAREEIIYFFYTALVIRYRLMIEEIEEFETFTLSEKLSNFAYASFDMMEEREKFVNETFRPYILHSCKYTEYEQRIEDLFADFLKNDSGKAASSDVIINDCSLRLIRKKYLHLVDFWIKDDSDGKEVTIELTDKITGLLQEALYTSVIDRSFDLAKFLFSNDILKKQVPLWDRIASSFEIK